jgi:uncharacterized delta-60 repeat protein
MSYPDVLGWLAAALMVATFGCREARAMRPLAVATNLAFIGYGLAASLVPVLTLHLLLLPINLWRCAEVLGAKESFVQLMKLMNRAAPALVLAACVVLTACGGGGGSDSPPAPATPPAVQLTEIYREWKVWEIRAKGRDYQLLEEGETDRNIAVSLDRELDGGLAFVPPEYPGKSRPQAGVFSRPGGMTFGAYADAPGLSQLNGDDAVGSQSLLNQRQAFRKNAPDATLEFVVSFVWIDLIDDNPEPPTHTECSWQAGGWVADCDRVMEAWVNYFLVVSADADRSGNSYEQHVAYKEGNLKASGWRDHFNHGTDEPPNGGAIKPEAIWDASDFDVLPAYDPLGGQNRLLVMLRRPKVVSIPIDTLPVGTEIHVQTFSIAQSFNHRQRESFVSAYLRDPANAGGAPGAEIRTTGLVPVPIQSGTVFDPNGDDTPRCAGAPDPLAGTIGFGQPSYVEPEIPGRGAPITLVRSSGARGKVSVRLRTVGGSATPAVDYEPQDARLVFLEGQTSLTLRLPILLDPLDEGDETVGLELSEPRGCAQLGQLRAELTIVEDDGAPPTTTLPARTVGGTVTGLVGSGLVLEDRAQFVSLPIAANGSFVFNRAYFPGTGYDVRVATPPSGPAQVCTVSRGSGTVATANVTDIAVDCVTPPPPSGLDASFGNGGIATAGPGGEIKAIALQNDGRIVAAIGNALARYNANGSLDTSFGSNGSVASVLGADGNNQIFDVLVQPDGRIVAAGKARNAGASSLGDDFAAARFNADGSRDAGFNGGQPLQVDWIGAPDRATRALLQPDGRIVLAGFATTTLTSSSDDTGFALARLNADGTLDSGFGSGGRAAAEIGSIDFGYAAALQSDGKIVVAGRVSYSRGDESDVGVVRFNADGTPDTHFGSNGTRTFDLSTNWDEATAIAVQPDGKLLLAVAYSDAGNFAFGVLRLTTGGERDATFGSNGFVSRHIGSGNDSPTAIVLQSDGRILLGGYAVNATTSFDVALARFNTNGTTDSSFGTAGAQVFDLFNSADGANDLLLQSDGRLVAAGSARNGANLLPLLLRLVP